MEDLEQAPKNNFPLILLIIVTCLSTLTSAFLFYQNQKLHQQIKQLQTQPSPSLTATPLPSADPTPNKFLDDIKPEPSPSASSEKIPTISTNNWKSASNNGVQFKIPPEAACNGNQACTLVSWTSQYQGHTLYHNIRVEVKDYLGGSRRDQFYQNMNPVECHDIYQEANFGSVKARQIAIDGGWCQGGGGGIVTVVGNKLVIVHNLFYNPETKVIDRWDIRDTLVSTLKQI